MYSIVAVNVALLVKDTTTYTGFSGEILGRYGHDTGAYPRENCIGPLRPLKPSPRCACGRGRVYGGCLYHSPQLVRGDHTYTEVRAGRRKQTSSGCGCLTSARECRSSMCVLRIEMCCRSAPTTRCSGGAQESEDGAPHRAEHAARSVMS